MQLNILASGGPKNKDSESNMYYLVVLGISFVSIILVYVIIIVCCQKEKTELLELVARQSDRNEMITEWTKKIIIEKLQITDESESLVS